MKKILILLFILILVGCSSNPSENNGKDVALNIIKKSNSEQYIKLVSFNKTNATEMEVSGQKIYKMDFEAEVEIIKEATYGGGFKASSPSRWFYPKNVGYRNKFKDVLVFQKTEKGWLGMDGELY